MNPWTGTLIDALDAGDNCAHPARLVVDGQNCIALIAFQNVDDAVGESHVPDTVFIAAPTLFHLLLLRRA